MSLSDDLLKYYLVDFENCVDVEDGPVKLSTWTELVINPDNWEKIIYLSFDENQLKSYFETLDEEKRKHYFTFGVACLICFIQRNFTGPDFLKDIAEFLKTDLFSDIDFIKVLALNNEDINVNTEYPQLLAASKIIFQTCSFNETLSLWWSWRATIIHQQILDELSPALLSTADRLRKEISKLELSGKFRNFLFQNNFKVSHLQITPRPNWRLSWHNCMSYTETYQRLRHTYPLQVIFWALNTN